LVYMTYHEVKESKGCAPARMMNMPCWKDVAEEEEVVLGLCGGRAGGGMMAWPYISSL